MIKFKNELRVAGIKRQGSLTFEMVFMPSNENGFSKISTTSANTASNEGVRRVSAFKPVMDSLVNPELPFPNHQMPSFPPLCNDAITIF